MKKILIFLIIMAIFIIASISPTPEFTSIMINRSKDTLYLEAGTELEMVQLLNYYSNKGYFIYETNLE